jgi:hypothetical protein
MLLNRPLTNVPGAGLPGEVALAATRLVTTLAIFVTRAGFAGFSSFRTSAADLAARLLAARDALKSERNGFFTRVPIGRSDLRTKLNSSPAGSIPHCSIFQADLSTAVSRSAWGRRGLFVNGTLATHPAAGGSRCCQPRSHSKSCPMMFASRNPFAFKLGIHRSSVTEGNVNYAEQIILAGGERCGGVVKVFRFAPRLNAIESLVTKGYLEPEACDEADGLVLAYRMTQKGHEAASTLLRAA